MDKIEIIVKTLTGNEISLAVSPNSTIGEIREIVETREGLPTWIDIICNGIHLDQDSITLKDYKIEEGSTLEYVLPIKNGDSKINLCVQFDRTGTVHKLEMEPTAQVYKLKDNIAFITGKKAAKMTIFYNGIERHDHQMIGHFFDSRGVISVHKKSNKICIIL